MAYPFYRGHKMTDDEIVVAIKQMQYRSDGYDFDEKIEDIERSLDYYYQRARGDEVEGRSQVVSGDLSAMVEAVLSQTVPAFVSSNLAEFHADGPFDEQQAHLEGAVVSHCIGANNGFIEIQSAMKDALISRLGIIKIWKEEKEVVNKTTLDDVPELAIADLISKDELNEVEISTMEKTGEDEEGNDLFRVVIRIKTTEQEMRLESCPPEHFMYTSDWDEHNMQRVPFVAYRQIDTRSTLMERGYDPKLIDLIPPYATDRTRASEARNPQKFEEDRHQVNSDRSMDWVEWYECYALLDIDGDGIAERWKVVYANESILEKEEVSRVPFATGVAILAPHRVLGVSLYDKLKQVQDVNTGLYRALFDNVNTVIKNKLFYQDGKVNVDDLNDGRPNSNVRIKGNTDVRAAVTSVPQPDLSQGILMNIQDQRTVRAEMGGASLEMQSGQAQLASHQVGSQGLDRAYSVFEQLSALMTENFAHTLVRNTVLLIHQTYREEWIGPVYTKQEGKWLAPLPAQWRERKHVKIKVGLSTGERTRKLAALDAVMTSQTALASQGMDGILVDKFGYYQAVTDWGRMSGLEDIEQYFIDPQSEVSLQAADAASQKAEAETEQRVGLMDKAITLEELRTAFDKYKHDSQLQFEFWDSELDAQVEEAKLVAAGTTQQIDTPPRPNGQDTNAQATEPLPERIQAAPEE